MGVHAGTQATQLKFTGIVKGQDLTTVINTLGQVGDDLGQLVEAAAIVLAPAAPLNTINPTHVVFTLAARDWPARLHSGWHWHPRIWRPSARKSAALW